MKAILQNSEGEIGAFEVPEPELQPGGVLVRTAFSSISAGTERAAHAEASKSLVSRAISRPDLVKQVVDSVRSEGLWGAYQKVSSRLNSLSALGYSCAGTVVGVGDGVREFQVGDRVACAGGGYANHSEMNFVPCNLAAKVPNHVGLDAASLATIGAIAMQGVRQAQLTLGETIAVIGAGLVGILTIQLVKAAGCRVIAIDLDPARAQRALKMGANVALCASDSNVAEEVRKFTVYGADAVIITAATPSTQPIETAAEIARDRGRIVIVGDVGLGVSRKHVYHKELSVVLSRSYGPGRYDPRYEREGIDYPIGYVRWTEKRNMESFLQLAGCGALDLAPLIQKRVPVSEGANAYAALRDSGTYTVLIEYPAASCAKSSESEPSISIAPVEPRASQESIKVGCIGAGGFAKGVIFPALRATKRAVFEAIATSSGISSESARRSVQFAKAQTPKQLIEDPAVEAVFVLSRHESHASYVVSAIAHRKPVFVEKPLAVNLDQLDEIAAAVEREVEFGRAPFVMVGFNRRFAPFTKEIIQWFANRREPMMLNLRVNAGFIATDHWSQYVAGGGRIVGELCHFVDWARAVVGCPIERIDASALPDSSRYNKDNVSARLIFEDGSIANLVYIANGDKSIGKELLEVFCEGNTARIDDFITLELARQGQVRKIKRQQDKGHTEEIRLTLDAMCKGNTAPIPFPELMEVTRATFVISESIAAGERIALRMGSPMRVSVGA